MTFAEVISNLSKMKEYHVCIYGCGRNGEAAVNCLNYAGIRIDAICDRQIGIELCGMKVISLDQLLQLDSQMICIITPATGVGEVFEKMNRHFDTVLGMETIYWMERYIPVLDHMWNWNCYAPFNSYDSPYINSNSMEYDLYDEDKCDRPSGIDFNDESQIALLKEMSPFYNDFYDDLEKGSFQRYKLNNGYFDEGDAALYYGILRKFTPEHIIEIGSGFSTALALDVKENYMENIQLSCVEPYPDRLFQNIKKDDKLQIFKEYVQKMELKFFDTLNAGDILFIDSSHVAKLGGTFHMNILRYCRD